MEEFAERVSKVGRFFLKLLIGLALLQIVLNALGVEFKIPVISQFIEMVLRAFSTLARAFDRLLDSANPR